MNLVYGILLTLITIPLMAVLLTLMGGAKGEMTMPFFYFFVVCITLLVWFFTRVAGIVRKRLYTKK
jgi:Na+/phosphate symporter